MTTTLIEHPTLRDLLVQHLGMTREFSVNPAIANCVKWQDWLEMAAIMDDRTLMETRRGALINHVHLVTRGQARPNMNLETRDLYRTPSKQDVEAGRLLHTRLTACALREYLAEDCIENVTWLRAAFKLHQGLATFFQHAKLDETSRDRSTDLADYEQLSDWDLLDVWTTTVHNEAFATLAVPRERHSIDDEASIALTR